MDVLVSPDTLLCGLAGPVSSPEDYQLTDDGLRQQHAAQRLTDTYRLNIVRAWIKVDKVLCQPGDNR